MTRVRRPRRYYGWYLIHQPHYPEFARWEAWLDPEPFWEDYGEWDPAEAAGYVFSRTLEGVKEAVREKIGGQGS